MRSHTKRARLTAAAGAVVLALGVAACGETDEEESASAGGSSTQAQTTEEFTPKSEFFVQEDYEKQLAQREATPEGPEGKPWEQAIEPEMRSTSEFKSDKSSGYELCFSNAANNNGWRQVGYKVMRAEVDTHDEISKFTVLDAEGKDEKQISDIEKLVSGGKCDALIVSPNTTATLTPAVEAACEEVPVIVFDRGVETDCPVTFISPIGGYAFGAYGAEFLVENVKDGGKVLALRILPGVDVLETRWSAAEKIFKEKGVDVVGVEFNDGDPAKTKSIVADYIEREGSIDGIWMDAGDTAVPAMEAFEDAGQDVPPFVGEDRLDFLRKWKEDGLKAIAPTYPTYQWRTPVIAALNVLQGKEVPKTWTLPQPAITQETLDDNQKPGMPPLHYSMCGCEELPGYPERWGGKNQ